MDIELERKGNFLFIKHKEDKRVVSFYFDNPSATAKEVKKALDDLGAGDKNIESYVLSKLAEAYDTDEIILESEQRVVFKPTFIAKDFIAEQVWDWVNPPQYCIYNFELDEFSYAPSIKTGQVDAKGREIIYRPVDNDHLRKGMVILPRKPVECEIDEVIQEATNYVLSGYDACGKSDLVKLLVLASISSHFLDKEKPETPISGMGVFAPILGIRGPSGSGKNRLANLLRMLNYHPFYDVSTYRIPSLYRPLDIWEGTLVIDEGDIKGTSETSELIHFLNSRATGTPIGRQNPDNPSKCDAFKSFGITIISQRRHFNDNATEGRTIPFYSDISEEKMPTLETDEMIMKGIELQDKLLYIRMAYWKNIFIDKTLWIDGVTDHRLNSALLPIKALAKHAPQINDIIKRVIEPIEKQKRELKAQSEDGVIINALWENINGGLFSTHNNLYYIGESKIDEKDTRGNITQSTVIPLTPSKLAETLKWTARRVRTIIQSLNISPENAPDRIRVSKYVYRAIFFDPQKLEKRLREFVVDYKKDELAKTIKIVTDVTDVTENHSPAQKQTILEDAPKKIAVERISVTNVTSVTLFQCPKCSTNFANVKDLEDHYQAYHLGEG